MPVKYMFTDTPFEDRIKGLYPLIKQTLKDWAEGKVDYEEFRAFMDYIRDEIEELDLSDNFSIGVWKWGWDEGKLFVPKEDAPMFLKMLKPENLYSQAVLDNWNVYWNSVDIKQRAKDYLLAHPGLTDAELLIILKSLPAGNELPLALHGKNTEQFLKLQTKNTEKYFQKIETLFQEIQSELKR